MKEVVYVEYSEQKVQLPPFVFITGKEAIKTSGFSLGASADGWYWLVDIMPPYYDSFGNGIIWRRNTTRNVWERQDGYGLFQIDGISKDSAVGVDTVGSVWVWQNQQWSILLNGYVTNSTQAVIGENNEIWRISKADQSISRWNAPASSWDQVAGIGPVQQIAIQNSNRAIALLQDGTVSFYNGAWNALNDPFANSLDPTISVAVTRAQVWLLHESGWLSYANY